jgi:hypothetical protein
MAFFAILVHEIITYFNIGFNFINLFSSFNTRLALTNLDVCDVKKEPKSESFICRKGKSSAESLNESSKGSRNGSRRSHGHTQGERSKTRHSSRHVSRSRSSNTSVPYNNDNSMAAQNKAQSADRLFIVDTIRERDSTNSISYNGLVSSNANTYYLPATTYNAGINGYSPVNSPYQYNVPSAPRPSNLSTPSTMSPLFPPELPSNTVGNNTLGNS